MSLTGIIRPLRAYCNFHARVGGILLYAAAIVAGNNHPTVIRQYADLNQYVLDAPYSADRSHRPFVFIKNLHCGLTGQLNSADICGMPAFAQPYFLLQTLRDSPGV